MKYLDKDEILSRLGFETKSSIGEKIVTALGPFGVGLTLGAAIALLLAPKSGRELRADIRHKVSQEGTKGAVTAKAGNGGVEPERRAV